jgi:hypothetical protein
VIRGFLTNLLVAESGSPALRRLAAEAIRSIDRK